MKGSEEDEEDEPETIRERLQSWAEENPKEVPGVPLAIGGVLVLYSVVSLAGVNEVGYPFVVFSYAVMIAAIAFALSVHQQLRKEWTRAQELVTKFRR